MLVIPMLAHAGVDGWFPLTLPPVHPILVNFTAALVPVSFASDLLGRLFRRRSLAETGWWTLLFAVVVTPLTAVAGWYWMRQMADMDHPQMPVHKWLGIALAVILPPLLWARWRTYRTDTSPDWRYLACAGLVVAALVVQGHLGGTMSFGADEAPTPAAETLGGPPTEMNGMRMGDAASPATRGAALTPPTTSPASGQIQWRDHIDLLN